MGCKVVIYVMVFNSFLYSFCFVFNKTVELIFHDRLLSETPQTNDLKVHGLMGTNEI